MTEGVVHLVRHAMVVTCPLPWRVSGFTVRSSQEIFPGSALSSRCGHFWFKNLRMVTVTSCCLLGSRLIYWSPYKPGFKTKPILSSFTQHRRINMTQNFFTELRVVDELRSEAAVQSAGTAADTSVSVVRWQQGE